MTAFSTLADDLVLYGPVPSMPSKVKIEGTSTAHDWDMNGTLIGGIFQVDPASTLDQAQATIPGLKAGKLNAKAQAIISLRSIYSSATVGADIMNGYYLETMKAKDYPKIEYRLSEMKLKEPHAAGKPFEFDTKGDLAIAGKTNAISMPVTLETLPDNKIKISGNTSFKMTSFGIEPPAPKLALGTLKTGDDVKITFEWSLGKREPVKK
jgi:polyisoprenoid-binding protein YceI